jgi:hypothetical protein
VCVLILYQKYLLFSFKEKQVFYFWKNKKPKTFCSHKKNLDKKFDCKKQKWDLNIYWECTRKEQKKEKKLPCKNWIALQGSKKQKRIQKTSNIDIHAWPRKVIEGKPLFEKFCCNNFYPIWTLIPSNFRFF